MLLPEGYVSPKKRTREDFCNSVIGRYPEGSWAYLGFKRPKWEKMYQVNFRSTAVENNASCIDKYDRWQANSYICPQAFSYGSRTSEKLYALQNIVIDIDCHAEKYGKNLRDIRISKLAWHLIHDAYEYGLPDPNHIVFTGRGLQVWWRHESMAANKCKNTWISIIRCFIEIIKKMIADHAEGNSEDILSCLTVDEQASLNPVGVFRIPGTYNPAAKTYATIVDGCSHIHTYKELVQFRNDYRAGSPITPKKPRGRYQVPGNNWNPSSWAESTALKIENLRNLRDDDLGNETRNNFCLALFCLYRTAGMEEPAAMERLHVFNEGFKRPMTDKELKSTLSSARRKLYQYSEKALIQLLDITAREAAAVGLKYRMEEPKVSKKETIEERNRKIIHLYKTTEMTQEEVGKAVGVSRKTVGDVLRNAGISRASRKAEKIQILNEKGNSVEEIGKKVGRSNRTVYRTLQNTRSEIAGGAPEAANTEPANSVSDIHKDNEVNNPISVETTKESAVSMNEASPSVETVEVETPVPTETIDARHNSQNDMDASQESSSSSACAKMSPPPHNNGYLSPEGERSVSLGEAGGPVVGVSHSSSGGFLMHFVGQRTSFPMALFSAFRSCRGFGSGSVASQTPCGSPC